MIDTNTGEVTESALSIISDNLPDVFYNIAAAPVSEEQAAILTAPLDIDDIDILPIGEVYLTQSRYRIRLNKAFRPGGWAMRPLSRPYVKDELAMQEWALYANAQFMAYAVGGAEYRDSNQRMNWSDVLETVKSNALMRLCKDLGIGSECWNKRFTESFKADYCFKVWVTDRNNKTKALWRRMDRNHFDGETGIVQDSPNQDKYTSGKSPKKQAPESPQKPLQSVTEATVAAGHSPEIPTTPKDLMAEVNRQLGQPYYNNPVHICNALGIKWPNPKDENLKQIYADILTAALDHAKERQLEKVT